MIRSIKMYKDQFNNKSKLNLLYITALNNSKHNGVNIAVTQLLNSICNYSNVYLLDLNNYNVGFSKQVKFVTMSNYLSFNIDIAIFESPFASRKFCVIARQLRKKRIKYVLVPHGCFNKMALSRKKLKKYLAINTLFKSFLNNAVATQYLTDIELENSIQYNKSIVIPNGINGNDEVLKIQKVRKFVFIGRKDVHIKGIDLLLSAVNEIKEELLKKGCKFELYGPRKYKDDEKYIDRYILENNLSDLVTNNDEVYDESKKEILLNSDVFIQTSRHEGFPMSLLESMTYGLPVMITEGTGITRIVEEYDAGWTCGTDIQSIKSMILRVIDSEDVLNKCINAKKLSEAYSWKSVSMKTLKIYDLLLSSDSMK